MNERNGRGVQAVTRAFEILERLSALEGEASLRELAEAVVLAPATVHRLLQTLCASGYVMQLPSRRYALGPAALRIGEAAGRRLSTWAVPALTGLTELTAETSNLAVLDGSMAAYVAQVPSAHQMRMFTEVGRRVFLHSTGVGKALLSLLPDDSVRTLLRSAGMPRFTTATLTNEADLLADLRASRARGFAVDDGEQEIGVRCFAIGVPASPVPMAVSISGPEKRLPMRDAARIAAAVRETARGIQSAVRW